MNFINSFGEYYNIWRQFYKDMKEWQSTPPKVYGEYLQGKRRKKKRKNK